MRTLRITACSDDNGLLILNGPRGSRLTLDFTDDDGETVDVTFRTDECAPAQRENLATFHAMNAVVSFLSDTLEGL